MERHSLFLPRHCRWGILAKAFPTRGCLVASDTTRSELTARSFTREDCGSCSELVVRCPILRLYSYGDYVDRLYWNQVFQGVQKSHQILFSLTPPASRAYMSYFKYNLSGESRRKNLLLPKKWALRASSLLFLSRLLFLSSTRKVPIAPCCVAPVLPYHRGATGVRAPCPFYPGMKLNWIKTFSWKSPLCFSTVHTAHLKPLEAVATLLLGTAKLATNMYRTTYSHNDHSTTQSNSYFVFAVAQPLQQSCPCSIFLPSTNTFLGKNAQETPLVKQILTGLSLGNTWHSQVPLEIFCEHFWWHHFRLLQWENYSRLQLPNAFQKDTERCTYLLCL